MYGRIAFSKRIYTNHSSPMLGIFVHWTEKYDSINFRLVIMFGAIFLVMVKGTLDIGGIDVVWQRAVDSGRIEFPE